MSQFHVDLPEVLEPLTDFREETQEEIYQNFESVLKSRTAAAHYGIQQPGRTQFREDTGTDEVHSMIRTAERESSSIMEREIYGDLLDIHADTDSLEDFVQTFMEEFEEFVEKHDYSVEDSHKLYEDSSADPAYPEENPLTYLLEDLTAEVMTEQGFIQ